ncbi:hypothetical protein GCM10014715_82040 [Streptomyces spiralis]|uniref:Uncharacterized protein n=1 Tax=Streptomyces spiralis TaxID=66376 RepID=A0A919AM05_9ACTN|nr:hypothetical protein GCM10014715_82040 [Streptomyces spiralis]
MGMGAKAGDHRNAEPAHVIGELIQLRAMDARIDQDQSIPPRTTTELAQTHSLCRTQTPSAT